MLQINSLWAVFQKASITCFHLIEDAKDAFRYCYDWVIRQGRSGCSLLVLNFYDESGQSLEHVALRGFGVSIFRNIDSLTGQCLEHPAVADSDLSRKVGVPEVPFNLSYSVLL